MEYGLLASDNSCRTIRWNLAGSARTLHNPFKVKLSFLVSSLEFNSNIGNIEKTSCFQLVTFIGKLCIQSFMIDSFNIFHRCSHQNLKCIQHHVNEVDFHNHMNRHNYESHDKGYCHSRHRYLQAELFHFLQTYTYHLQPNPSIQSNSMTWTMHQLFQQY